MTDIIKGYKAFNGDMTNRYKVPFAEGETYSVEGPLSFGIRGNGYHFCKRLEDTLRYFSAFDQEIKIAEVTSIDEAIEYSDEYYGYYEMYVARTLTIDKILTREEIISMFLDAYDEQVVRFLNGYKLTNEEIEIFRLKYASKRKVQLALSYYQEGYEETYYKEYKLERISK